MKISRVIPLLVEGLAYKNASTNQLRKLEVVKGLKSPEKKALKRKKKGFTHHLEIELNLPFFKKYVRVFDAYFLPSGVNFRPWSLLWFNVYQSHAFFRTGLFH